MKNWLLSFGISTTMILGGGFLIRFVRDGDFYIAEFIGGIVGIILIIISFLLKGSMKQDNSF
ncbi:hypothetical protein CYL18_02350 [Pradoshia eiseniae]|uniref:Uncharacterized protein n=1 Tax=Pradoshia eiseniae TaxID=2064768 RepID=A0A2S7N3Z9_9BACI|nr:hypothetical protein [Pradoshia eiseniae]PQD96749.1 hypothetical protein CYL18_02350 [Pradoshia eiseniae]